MGILDQIMADYFSGRKPEIKHNHQMCERCKVPMAPGKALVTVYGNASENYRHGMVMYPVNAALADVIKCPSCGHSRSTIGHHLTEHDPGITVIK